MNAVYAGKLEQIADEQERAAETGKLRREYKRDIDILRLASELVVDDIVEPEDLALAPKIRLERSRADATRQAWPRGASIFYCSFTIYS